MLAHGLVESSPQHGSVVVPGAVFDLAALLVKEGVDVCRSQLVELQPAQGGDEMFGDDELVMRPP